MVAIAINRFQGMTPRYGDQVIGSNSASLAKNCLLLSGELRSLHGKAIAADFRAEVAPGYLVKRVYKILDDNGDFSWEYTDDETHDLIKGPLVNDAFDRYYSTSEIDAPRMNTRARIEAGDPYYLLGVPAPTNQLTVTAIGGTGPALARAYTYTFLTAYSEEGPPIDATVIVGPEDATWTLSNFNVLTDIPDYAERNITDIRIYRTVTAANGVAEYHFVAQIPIEPAVAVPFIDIAATVDVALNTVIESISWDAPPSGMRGIIAHPNGFLVGFNGRDLYFSLPYRPHAWPAGLGLSTKDPIVGLGVFGDTIVVATRGFPYTVTGVRPENMSFTQADTPEPCAASRRSIVSMPFGVYYPTDNGLVLVSPSGISNATQNILTKDEWRRDYNFFNIKAARWQSQYVAFYTPNKGFMFAPDEPQSAFVELGNNAWTHQTIQNDTYSGDTYLIYENVVYFWNPTYGAPQSYSWKTKEVISPKPVNMGAFKIEFSSGNAISDEVIEGLLADNAIRFQYPLNPINFSALNAVRKINTLPNFVPPDIAVQTSQATHKSPLIDISSLTEYFNDSLLRLRLWADDDLVYEGIVKDSEIYRLPDGYKATRFYAELYGNVNVRSLKIAETSKELATV